MVGGALLIVAEAAVDGRARRERDTKTDAMGTGVREGGVRPWSIGGGTRGKRSNPPNFTTTGIEEGH